MTLYNWIVVACWAVFIIYWFASWSTSKRTTARAWGAMWVSRIVLIGILLIIATSPYAKLLNQPISAGSWLQPLGALFAVIGIAFAVWARYYLGQNWGMPMSVKESPDLVTTGPYTYVRHPIYTGVLLALLGSALVSNAWWLFVFIAGAAYFTYSATREEKLMMETFPDTYPAYKARTKMLIPFIL